MNTGLHPLIALPCTPAAYQLDLQMVERIDVREAMLDGMGGVKPRHARAWCACGIAPAALQLSIALRATRSP